MGTYIYTHTWPWYFLIWIEDDTVAPSKSQGCLPFLSVPAIIVDTCVLSRWNQVQLFDLLTTSLFGLLPLIPLTLVSSQQSLKILNWLVISTPLKNISQLGWFFPIYGKKQVMFQTTNQLNYMCWNSLKNSGWWFCEFHHLIKYHPYFLSTKDLLECQSSKDKN